MPVEPRADELLKKDNKDQDMKQQEMKDQKIKDQVSKDQENKDQENKEQENKDQENKEQENKEQEYKAQANNEQVSKNQEDKAHEVNQLEFLVPEESNQETGMNLNVIARIRTAFPEKFGIPRQSGIVGELKGQIVFEPEYRNPDCLRGMEGFSHLWLIWGFTHGKQENTWSALVKPPRLGGNARMGVFATRSPFRPNALGLSSVRLERIQSDPDLGMVLYVSGADLMDGTPIYDIKPYLAFTDSHPDARGGFSEPVQEYGLLVEFPSELLEKIPIEHHNALYGVLAHDPRPSYHNDPNRIYGFGYAGYNIRFRVSEGRLSVCEVTVLSEPEK